MPVLLTELHRVCDISANPRVNQGPQQCWRLDLPASGPCKLPGLFCAQRRPAPLPAAAFAFTPSLAATAACTARGSGGAAPHPAGSGAGTWQGGLRNTGSSSCAAAGGTATPTSAAAGTCWRGDRMSRRCVGQGDTASRCRGAIAQTARTRAGKGAAGHARFQEPQRHHVLRVHNCDIGAGRNAGRKSSVGSIGSSKSSNAKGGGVFAHDPFLARGPTGHEHLAHAGQLHA